MGIAQARVQTLADEIPQAMVRISARSGEVQLGLRELWQYRELLYFFAWRDIKLRYKQTVIGAAWAVFQPFLTMAVFSLFFGALARIPSQGLPYPVFYYCALLPWLYFAGALQNATNTVVDHQRITTKVYFPRLVLPLVAVLTGLVDFVIGFVAFLGMMLYYRMLPTPAALLLPLLLMFVVLTALGVGLWLSALNAIYRDVRYIVPFLVQFWMFASPVAYPSALVPERWRWLYGLNPMAGVIESFRWALTGSGQPPGALMLASGAMVILALVGGLVYFRKMEGTIADVV